MKEDSLFLNFREKLIAAKSKESQKEIIRELLQVVNGRYHGLRGYVVEGNADISERLTFLKKYSSGKVLDVGTYDGYFAHELEKDGLDVTCTDMMDEVLGLFEKERLMFYKESQMQCIIAFAEDLPFKEDSFDTVIISHTLEHVFDPAKAVNEALRVCKKNGNVLVIVPTSLGNDPTHLRVIDDFWIRNNFVNCNRLSEQMKVGNGVAYIIQK